MPTSEGSNASPTLQTLASDLRERLGAEVDLARLDPGASLRPWSTDEETSSRAPAALVFNEQLTTGTTLGKGGMGIVYEAHQPTLERKVAVKLLHTLDATRRACFLAEAVCQGQLEHPNIVPVHGLGSTASSQPFLAMKRVSGQTWAAARQADPGPLDEQLQILLQVCNAVAYAHSRGIVHNDLKPSNVMLGAFGEVLADCAKDTGSRSAVRAIT